MWISIETKNLGLGIFRPANTRCMSSFGPIREVVGSDVEHLTSHGFTLLESVTTAIGQRQVAVECRPGNPQRRADMVNAQTAILVQALGRHDPWIVGTDRPAAAETSPCPGCRKARLGPLLNQSSLELRQAREDVEHQLARGCGGVDGAVQEGAEADALAQQPLHQRDQVGHRTSQSVQPPDHQRIARL